MNSTQQNNIQITDKMLPLHVRRLFEQLSWIQTSTCIFEANIIMMFLYKFICYNKLPYMKKRTIRIKSVGRVFSRIPWGNTGHTYGDCMFLEVGHMTLSCMGWGTGMSWQRKNALPKADESLLTNMSLLTTQSKIILGRMSDYHGNTKFIAE